MHDKFLDTNQLQKHIPTKHKNDSPHLEYWDSDTNLIVKNNSLKNLVELKSTIDRYNSQGERDKKIGQTVRLKAN